MQIISKTSERFHAPGQVRHERGTFHDPELRYAALNTSLCKRIMEVLLKHYSSPFWCIEAAVEHGIVKIWMQGFAQWPYVIKISTLKGDPGMKAVVEAGGHLLERLRIPRSSFNIADYKAALSLHPSAFSRNKKAPV